MSLGVDTELTKDTVCLDYLESMAIRMPEVAEHPNRVPFGGVLTLVDTPSDRPPSGSRGHRVLLTSKAVEDALPSLLGMAIDFTPMLDGHDTRAKIGVITAAELEAVPALRVLARGGQTLRVRGRAYQLKVGGYLYGKDFPEVMNEMRARGKGELGMSYEIANVHVEDVEAAVWAVTKFTFTGAAVLLKNKAAYQQTWIELAAKTAIVR